VAFKFPWKLPQRARNPDYPDDIFDTSRMSFGDHIEALRSRLLKALYGLAFCLLIGFVLDWVGKEVLHTDNFGIGIPMMKVITEPVESQVRNFYIERNEKSKAKVKDVSRTTEDEIKPIREKLAKANGDRTVLDEDEKKKLLGYPVDTLIHIPTKAFVDAGMTLNDPKQTEITVTVKVYPGQISTLSEDGVAAVGSRKYLTTLSAQEAFMVYFQVSLLCGAVLASPWIFYQVWAFVSAGLYPHEKRYIHLFLPISVLLFVGGVLLCQFVVLPGAVKALLGFNGWVDLDPDLRLKEWLGFALILPIVFGVSFQAPLVMFFLCRIRLCTHKTFLSYWRAAVFILAVFAAVITPTPDVVTLLYLYVPMLGLYFVGIGVCYLFPPPAWTDEDQAEAQVAV
jgi:sec-independent protein translocase protein TatC